MNRPWTKSSCKPDTLCQGYERPKRPILPPASEVAGRLCFYTCLSLWMETPWIPWDWHLVAATEEGSTHPTGMHTPCTYFVTGGGTHGHRPCLMIQKDQQMGGNWQWRGERQHNNAFISGKQGQETWLPEEDPGFPRRGTANPWVWGKNLLFLNILAKKLHEDERYWTKRERRASLAPPLDAPMAT